MAPPQTQSAIITPRSLSNKHVHWSQYADEISFLTIRDVVRLSDDADDDDDYFSDEEVDEDSGSYEPVESKVREKSHSHHSRSRPSPPRDNQWVVESVLSNAPPTLPPPMVNGKTRYVRSWDSDSLLSDDSNFYEDTRHPLSPVTPKKTHSKPPRQAVEQKPVRREKVPKKLVDHSFDAAEGFGESVNMSNRRSLPACNCDNSSSGSGSFAGGSSTSSSASKVSSKDGKMVMGFKKSHDNHWVSPQIHLSKRNNSTSGRRESTRMGGRRYERAVSPQERRHSRTYEEGKKRTASENRRGRGDFVEEPSKRRFSSKQSYNVIEEEMKPNLLKPRSKPQKSSIHPSKKIGRHSTSRHSSKTSRKPPQSSMAPCSHS